MGSLPKVEEKHLAKDYQFKGISRTAENSAVLLIDPQINPEDRNYSIRNTLE